MGKIGIKITMKTVTEPSYSFEETFDSRCITRWRVEIYGTPLGLRLIMLQNGDYISIEDGSGNEVSSGTTYYSTTTLLVNIQGFRSANTVLNTVESAIHFEVKDHFNATIGQFSLSRDYSGEVCNGLAVDIN